MVFCIGAVFLKEKRCSAWCDKKEALIFLLVGLFSSIIFYLEYMYIGGHLDLVNTIFSWFSFSFIKRKGKLWEPTYPAADSTEFLQKTVEKNPDHGLSRLRSLPEGPVYYSFGTRVSSPAGKWEALSNMVWHCLIISARSPANIFPIHSSQMFPQVEKACVLQSWKWGSECS